MKKQVLRLGFALLVGPGLLACSPESETTSTASPDAASSSVGQENAPSTGAEPIPEFSEQQKRLLMGKAKP